MWGQSPRFEHSCRECELPTHWRRSTSKVVVHQGHDPVPPCSHCLLVAVLLVLVALPLLGFPWFGES